MTEQATLEERLLKRLDECVFPMDNWQLRAPAIESLSATFTFKRGPLFELCKGNFTPNRFRLLRRAGNGTLNIEEHRDLTAGNLASSWGEKVCTIKALCA